MKEGQSLVERGGPRVQRVTKGPKVHRFGDFRVIFESSLTLKNVHLVRKITWRTWGLSWEPFAGYAAMSLFLAEDKSSVFYSWVLRTRN